MPLEANPGGASAIPSFLSPTCPRCKGKLLRAGSDGDRACFTCGHIEYRLPPVADTQVRRRPSSGGRSLD